MAIPCWTLRKSDARTVPQPFPDRPGADHRRTVLRPLAGRSVYESDGSTIDRPTIRRRLVSLIVVLREDSFPKAPLFRGETLKPVRQPVEFVPGGGRSVCCHGSIYLSPREKLFGRQL